MELLNRVWRSSLGKKYLMALSGVLLFLFAVGHMVGNLQIFLGPEAINRYAAFLQSTPELLWPVRLGLLALVVLHAVSAIRVSLENKAARPVAYACAEPLAASYASRTMLVGGLMLGAFIIYHLLHFTVQATGLNLTGRDFTQFMDAQQRHDVFKMIVVGFHQPIVALIYLLGMACLCLHLAHGVQAWAQSVGL